MASISKSPISECPKCHAPFTSHFELYNHYTKCGTVIEDGDSPDSEWEYEYSATETETFYVTLDLPVARSDANVEEGPKGGRLTKRKDKWLNSTHLPFIEEKRKARGEEMDAADGKELEHAETNIDIQSALPGNNAPSSDASQVAEDFGNGCCTDNQGATSGEPSKASANGTSGFSIKAAKSNGDMAPAHVSTREPLYSSSTGKGIWHDLQILELHNKNPIMIYRNQQFECEWAQNIGTELLFIKHSDITSRSEGHFPIVKKLPGDVDLLAVSGVRVVGRPINIKAKNQSEEKVPKAKPTSEAATETAIPNQTNDSSRDANADAPENALRIPIGNAAAKERKEQAKFLERLSAIKVKRGELDEITVTAIVRKDKRAKGDRHKLRLKEHRVLRDKRVTERRKAMARMRIKELDEMDAEAEKREWANKGKYGGTNDKGTKVNGSLPEARLNQGEQRLRDAASQSVPSDPALSKTQNTLESSNHRQAQNASMRQRPDAYEEDDDEGEDEDSESNDDEEMFFGYEDGWDLNGDEAGYQSGNAQEADMGDEEDYEDYDMEDDDREDAPDHEGDSPTVYSMGEATDVEMDDAI